MFSRRSKHSLTITSCNVEACTRQRATLNKQSTESKHLLGVHVVEYQEEAAGVALLDELRPKHELELAASQPFPVGVDNHKLPEQVTTGNEPTPGKRSSTTRLGHAGQVRAVRSHYGVVDGQKASPAT